MRVMASNLTALLGGVLLSIATPVFAGGEAGQLLLRDLGWRFIGHTTQARDDGTVDVLNAMFVHYLLPAERRHDYPIVMIHGGGGQGTDWLETPDGRDGWVDYFVADGWDVYVVDRPNHGRAQSNPTCDANVMSADGFANTGLVSLLATSDAAVWPGGEPTTTNDAVIYWAATSATAAYCGDAIAAEAIATLLDEIGPAILFAHSMGGGSTLSVPDVNPENIVGIIAFEVAGASPVIAGPGGPPALGNWQVEPPLPENFTAVDRDGCPMQDENPSRLVNYDGIPLVLAATEHGLNVLSRLGAFTEISAMRRNLDCEVAAWQQAGVDATGVYLPDRGLNGGGHFAMGQIDNAKYAREFIRLASEIEASSTK